ncbi:MAG: TetR family transcriptional regulator [Meiothermus sp.]
MGEREKPPVGRPRSTASHQAILEAARELLINKGYAAMTIEGIAAKAGVGKQTIYRWWPNKAALFMELYEREATEYVRSPSLGSLRRELVEQTRNTLRFWRETVSGQAYRSIIAEAQSDPQALERWRQEFMPKRRQYTLQTLLRAQKRGELRPDLKLDVVTDLLYGYGWYRLLTDRLEEDGEVEAMVDALLEGILSRSNPS